MKNPPYHRDTEETFVINQQAVQVYQNIPSIISGSQVVVGKA